MFAGAGIMEFAVSAVEVRDAAKERQELVLRRELPTVEIHLGRGEGLNGTVVQAGIVLALPDRGAEIGVAAEELNLILGPGDGRHTSNQQSQNEKPQTSRTSGVKECRRGTWAHLAPRNF